MSLDAWITIAINSATIVCALALFIWRRSKEEEKLQNRLEALEKDNSDGANATSELRKLCHELLLTVTRMSVTGSSQSEHLKDIEIRLRKVEHKYLRSIHETPT